MKTLKKNPLVQRMEDMRFPGSAKKKPKHYIKFSSDGYKVTYDSKGNEIKRVKYPLITIRNVTPRISVGPLRVKEKLYSKGVKLVNGKFVVDDGVCVANVNGVPSGDHKIIWQGNVMPVNYKEKVLWEGHEWLKSINDDMGLTFMNRLGWHVLAIVVFIGAVWLSAYILTHGLVCAPASLNGKTVINCLQK